MTAEDSNRVSFEKDELDDTLSCCICTEFYTDPKALPCIHTFCMKCIQQIGLNAKKGPGDEMPCPICRGQFKIPQEGFSGLPNNFLIAKLIQAANVPNPSESSRNTCDICLEDNEETGKEIPGASMYCIDCKQKLCEDCCRHHRKFKLNKNHKLISINEQQVSNDNAMAKLAQSVCELHEQKVLDIYCDECKTVECAVCFIDGHKQHEGSHVSKYVDDFRKQIESNIETINQCSSQTEMKKAELVKIQEDMKRKVERLEEDVMKRRDEVKQFADSQANSLLQSLSSLRQSKLKEIQIEAGDFDAHLSCLQSYSSYCQKMMAKGSDSDICRAVSDLSVKAIELQEQCKSLSEREIQFFKVNFTKSEFKEFLEDDNLIGNIEDDCNSSQRKESTSEVALIKKENSEIEFLKENINLERREKETVLLKNEHLKKKINSEKMTNQSLQVDIDKLRQELETQRKAVKDFLKGKEQASEECEKTKTDEIQSEHISDPVLVRTIRPKAAEEKKKEIRGLTIIDKELFVVIEKSSVVEVYDSMTLDFSRRWNLKELNRPKDVVSCYRNKCLYILDYKNTRQAKIILRVDANGKLINNWSTALGDTDDMMWDGSLSVTDESNVILTVLWENKLKEYSPGGQLIREIKLVYLIGPLHAIKLTNGQFLVSHEGYGNKHRVGIEDADGNLQKSFGGKPGKTIGQMNFPIHLSVDRNGFVMVVDKGNSRVMLLDSDLEFEKEILSKDKHGLRKPYRILLDESSDRLFVAENGYAGGGYIFIFKLT